jgi:hypothetical protein
MPTISGTVLDDAGDPVAGRVVRAYRRDTGALLAEAVTSTGSDPADADFASVSLLLHMDGANGSTTFIDSSGTPKTVTRTGDAQISTAQSKFGGASGYFDGVGDSLSLTGTSFGTGDFTVEGFIRTSVVSQTFIILDTRNSDFTNAGYALYVRTSNKLTFGRGDPFVGTEGSTDVPINEWNHIALTRQSGVVKGFLNGVEEFSVTDTKTFSLTAWRIGHQYNASGTHGAFYIDELRVTSGVARYTANFTPPTAPFPETSLSLDSGEYQITTAHTGECNVVCLDDAGGTTYNDLILRTTPV